MHLLVLPWENVPAGQNEQIGPEWPSSDINMPSSQNFVGLDVGSTVGCVVGSDSGCTDGHPDGKIDGTPEGGINGWFEGCVDGLWYG